MKMPIVALAAGELLPLLRFAAQGNTAAQKRLHLAFLPIVHGMASEAAKIAPHGVELDDLQQEAALALQHSIAFCRCWTGAEQVGLNPATLFLDCVTDWTRDFLDASIGREEKHAGHLPERYARRVRDGQHDAEALMRARVQQLHADCSDAELGEWTAVHEGLNAAEERAQACGLLLDAPMAA